MANELIFRPTLLVGVGGTGCRIAETVYDRARRAGATLAGRVQVIGFDTDENDMRQRAGLADRQRVRFSSNFTVEELLDRFPQVERDWFVTPRSVIPMEIRRMTLLDGAAQLRMLSRLGLFEAQSRSEIDNRLGAVAAELARHDNRGGFTGQINVLMVGSLAGATGSGSYLQLALVINDVCRRQNIEAGVRGLFLMPDVYVRSGTLPGGQVANVQANGYAAIKEFHAVTMRTTERAGRYDFSFEFAPGRQLQSGDMPFLSLAVIDYEDMKGGNLGRSVDAYRRAAERAAYTMLFTPIGSRADSVTVNDARRQVAVAGRGTHNRLSAIGLSALAYPHEEIVSHLGARLAREVLTGDWLRLDRAYRGEMRRFRDQKAAGNVNAQEPEVGASYQAEMRRLALDEQQSFFRELWDGLNPVIRNEVEGDTVQPLPVRYLDALETQILASFWNTPDLIEIAARKLADADQFASEAALAETVRRFEYRLDDDLRRIDAALASRPTDILIGILTTADDAGEADWRDHHLQSFLIRGGPHLVRNRVFLYALRDLVAERLRTLRPDETRKRLYRLANAFDTERGQEPTTRSSPRILGEASEIGQRGGISRLFKGRLKNFVEQYVAYCNGSIRAMRSFAEERARQRAYEILLQEIDEQQRVLTGLFLEVEGALERLDATIAKDEHLHDANVLGENTLFVCADATSKRALWEELRDAAGGQRLAPEANRALAREVYAKARRNRRARRPEGLDDLRALFWQTVVEDFAVKRVATDFSAVHAMSVMGALQAECRIKGEDLAERLRAAVGVVEAQSEPMVTLTSPTNGQQIRFWAINPALREELRGKVDLDLLLNPSGQGTQPVEEPEFPITELLCVTMQVNLEVDHLAKFRPPLRQPGTAAPERAGQYFNEYQKMVDELVEAAGDNRIAATFTPHIHRDWHKPGVLPEISAEVTRRLVQEVNRAIVAALVTGALRREETHGRRVAEVVTVGRVPTGSVSLTLVESHDMFEIVRAFERRPEAVRAALRLWKQELARLGRGKDNTPAALLEALVDGSRLVEVLQIAESRNEEEMRAGRVVDLVAGLAQLTVEAVAAMRPDLPERARLDEADRLVGTAATAAMGTLRRDLTRETFRNVEALLARGLERWREDAGFDRQ